MPAVDTVARGVGSEERFQKQKRGAAWCIPFLSVMRLNAFYIESVIHQNAKLWKHLRQSIDAETEVASQQHRNPRGGIPELRQLRLRLACRSDDQSRRMFGGSLHEALGAIRVRKIDDDRFMSHGGAEIYNNAQLAILQA